jgi:hypothetical protein
VALTVEDRLEMLELLSRYNLAADDNDVEAMVADFTEDGVIEGFYSTGQGKEAMRRDLPAIFEAEGTLKRHLALNPRMAGDGETAEVSYILLVVEGEESPAVGATALIRDELRKVGGRWLVARHRIEVDPSIKVYEHG